LVFKRNYNRKKKWKERWGVGDKGAKSAEKSKKRETRRKRDAEKAQHRAFPRGPPPQYYPGSDLLNIAFRMGSGEPD
jgi:hypothetical protein